MFLRAYLVTLLGLVCEWPGGARADEVLEAGRRRYEVGAKRFEEGRFLEAAQAFEEAYKLTPRTALLFNAARAYDKAREIGLPLRMFRYQFGPFLAYFHSNRNDDLLALTDYARGVTEMSEETWLWYGFGLYRKGDYDGALKAWQKADSINPNFFEDQARKAMQLVQ